ncbi:hypothetical protein [Mesorhizobium sp. KR9-304]|uniref:hypothetical protein n=1 Tax=Mesorhizobium sp. KR9-304 TaxID=3156614 RepID=UPI0032B3BFA9
MTRLDRNAPLPDEMQGRWVEVDNGSILIIDGGEITCFGQVVEYDYKEISEVAGGLTVTLGVDDKAQEDTFQRANITGLVISPEGDFLAYNVKFGCEFVRESS